MISEHVGMTVRELIDHLSVQDQDAVVVVKDGSSMAWDYCLVEDILVDRVWDRVTGEVGLAGLTDMDAADGYTEGDVVEGGIPCVALLS